MASRYGGITGTEQIANDYQNINIAFENVEADVDAKAAIVSNHINDNVRHVTEAEHTKLASVQPGAEPNQNAFSRVNGMDASTPTDELTIVGDVGVTVTQNPNDKSIHLTVTGESAPGPHAATHLTGGIDPIPVATGTTSGLMPPESFQAIADNTEAINDITAQLAEKANPQSLYTLTGSGFPKFTKYANNPLVLGNSETLNQAGFATVISTEGIISNPIDKFYMYWAGHDGGGIWLSTAPHPLGPWTTYGQVITDASMYPSGETVYHISSPEVIYMPDLNVLRMYFHRAASEGQFTEYCHSTNGINWTKQPGRVTTPLADGSWTETELSYFRVCRVNEVYYATYQGRDRRANVKGLGFGISSDGVNFRWSDMPLFYNTQFKDGYTPHADLGGAPCLINLKGQLWVFFGDGVTNRTIKASPLNDPFERYPLVKTILPSTEIWEGGSVESPNFLYHDGYLYMYYNGQNASKERAIGVAYYKLGV